VRLTSKLGCPVVLSISLMAMSLTLATGASAATAPGPILQPGSTTPVYAQTWQMGSATPTSAIGVGLCKGSFEGPSADLSNGMSAGVAVQCSASTPLTAGIVLQRCVRDGGPDDYNCSDVASSYSGLVVQYYVNVPTSYNCSHSKSAQYRPEAVRLSADYVDYPNVIGNVVTVGCG
jgi:hypothetical protein